MIFDEVNVFGAGAEVADVRVAVTAAGKRHSSKPMRLMAVSLDRSSGTSGLHRTSG